MTTPNQKYQPHRHRLIDPANQTSLRPIHHEVDDDGEDLYYIERHPGVSHLLALFEYQHLESPLTVISSKMYNVAYDMADRLKENYELTAGLRKLLEAKDCFVRAEVIERRRAERASTTEAITQVAITVLRDGEAVETHTFSGKSTTEVSTTES